MIKKLKQSCIHMQCGDVSCFRHHYMYKYMEVNLKFMVKSLVEDYFFITKLLAKTHKTAYLTFLILKWGACPQTPLKACTCGTHFSHCLLLYLNRLLQNLLRTLDNTGSLLVFQGIHFKNAKTNLILLEALTVSTIQ